MGSVLLMNFITDMSRRPSPSNRCTITQSVISIGRNQTLLLGYSTTCGGIIIISFHAIPTRSKVNLCPPGIKSSAHIQKELQNKSHNRGQEQVLPRVSVHGNQASQTSEQDMEGQVQMNSIKSQAWLHLAPWKQDGHWERGTAGDLIPASVLYDI